MTALDKFAESFSLAFDSIIGTKIYYKDNDLKIIQAGLIALLPLLTAYLLDYNRGFGIDLKIKIQNYPLILFLFLAATLYVIVEPKIVQKSGAEVASLVFLSVHIFSFALGVNLIYAVILQLSKGTDILQKQISNAATLWKTPLSEPAFAAIYGMPFLLLSVGLVGINTYRSYRIEGKSLRALLVTGLFWRSSLLVGALAILSIHGVYLGRCCCWWLEGVLVFWSLKGRVFRY